VALQQPLRLVAAVGKNFARPFLSWTRTRKTGELPISRWQFQTKFPQFVVSGASSKAVFRYWEEGTLPRTHARAARALRAYQFHIGFTPGLVLLTCLVLGLVAAAGVGPARHAGQRAACLLWVATGVGLLLVADTYQFSWRYQLPALVTLPPAAALALSALTRARRVTGPEQLSGKEARAPGADAEGPGPAAAPPVHL
jgi:hypothetical protein